MDLEKYGFLENSLSLVSNFENKQVEGVTSDGGLFRFAPRKQARSMIIAQASVTQCRAMDYGMNLS